MTVRSTLGRLRHWAAKRSYVPRHAGGSAPAVRLACCLYRVQAQRAVIADALAYDVLANSTEHEEYRPS